MEKRGLVLGGGGVTGIAWMTGLLLGLDEKGLNVLTANRLIGTSAGSAVAAQIRSGMSWSELFERQTNAALQVNELQPTPEQLDTVLHTLPGLMHLDDPTERFSRIRSLALDAATVNESTRRHSIAERLPVFTWPDHPLTVVAVDVSSGAVKLFERSSGAGLVDAVAASCAVPGLWPPVTIGERRYMDGGVRSSDNADLALDCERLIIISPLGKRTGALPGGGLPAQIEQREHAGLHTFLIEPDAIAHEAIGPDPFDGGRRTAAAEAGRAQGRLLAAQVQAFWN